MNIINEKFQNETIQLSAAQKYVLAKLIAAKTPLNAYEEVSRGSNVVAARDMLTKLGLMTTSENNAEITEQGIEALRKEALIDESGQLTEEGQLWGYAKSPEQAAEAENQIKGKPESPIEQSPLNPPEGGNIPTDTTAVATQDAGGADAFSLESLEMIRGFREIIKEREFFKKAKS